MPEPTPRQTCFQIGKVLLCGATLQDNCYSDHWPDCFVHAYGLEERMDVWRLYNGVFKTAYELVTLPFDVVSIDQLSYNYPALSRSSVSQMSLSLRNGDHSRNATFVSDCLLSALSAARCAYVNLENNRLLPDAEPALRFEPYDRLRERLEENVKHPQSLIKSTVDQVIREPDIVDWDLTNPALVGRIEVMVLLVRALCILNWLPIKIYQCLVTRVDEGSYLLPGIFQLHGYLGIHLNELWCHHPGTADELSSLFEMVAATVDSLDPEVESTAWDIG